MQTTNRPSSSRGGRRNKDDKQQQQQHESIMMEEQRKLAVAGNSLLYPEEFDTILSSMIDEEYIVSVTGIKDIARIEYISLQIDSNFQSILDLPDLLPNLKHLVLDNSTIGSIRDLGVGLRGITSLSLSGCGLRDIDGIGVLTGLQELCLTDNYISDITPLTMHENLQNLNLSGNKIADISFGGVLSSCPNLRSLFLSRNPIERAPQYRAVVSYLVPSLEMLDGSPIDTNAALKVTSSTLNDVNAALSAIEDELDDEGRLENEIFSSFIRDSAPTASINSTGRPGTAAGSSSMVAGSMEGLPDTGSELTHGSAIVLAGNVAAAMRRRRNHQTSSMNNSAEMKSEGRRRTGTGGETKEFESALDVLDSVLLAPPSPAQADEAKEKMYFKEGDITETLLGNSAATPAKGKLKSDLSIDALVSPVANKKPAPFSFDDAPTNLISATKRPKSAFTGTTYHLAPTSTSSNSGKLGSPEKKGSVDQLQNGKVPPVPSPRQKNSSRPQSAVNPALLGTLSLPFNVAVPASETTGVAINNRRRPSRGEAHDSDDDERIVDIVRARKIVGMRTESDGSPLMGKSKKGGSIVHLDIVKRTMKLEDIEDQPSNYTVGDNGRGNTTNNDSDVEEIAITHSERLRMMSSSASNTTSTMHKNRQNVLLKLQSKGLPSSFPDADDDEEEMLPPSRKLSGSSLGSGKLSSNNTPRQSAPSSGSSNGTASKAGKSLGFNLAGSLAAIDQWVQDMSSEDDASEEELERKASKTSRGSSADFTIEVPSMTPRSGFYSTNNNTNGLKDKILSRDAIFHMCSNSSNTSEKRQKDADPLLSSRRGSRNSILSTDEQLSEDVTQQPHGSNKSSAHTINPAAPHPIVQKAAQVSAQKAALLSKVSIAKVSSSGDPVRATVTTTEQSFIADDDKPLSKPVRESSSGAQKIQGQRAVHMTDVELVDLLKQPPKAVPMLRTKTSFQDFFRGIEAHRFRKLLQLAYDDIADKSDRESKIKRRMELMEDVFA